MYHTTPKRRGLCLVIAAPSGAGKSTVALALLVSEPELRPSISITTRAPRPGETDGVHYHFRSEAEFDRLAATGALLEHATVFGRRYGTPRAPVVEALLGGLDVIFDIDWQGWRQMKTALPGDCVGVFIVPPSLAALEQRLTLRAGDAPDEISRRMQAAKDELSHWDEFDHVLVNDDLDACVCHARSVLQAARCATARSLGVRNLVAALRS